ncbi:DUF159 family protein [Deltaproteobacteria bacterium]|nr:DUF159 family protein [Deltaproteobacteria bacterium]
MCGRFALHHPNDEIHEKFSIERPTFLTEPRYNIAPTQVIAVVTPAREVAAMRWGLIPRWSKDGKPFINARGETIAEKPTFKQAFQARRIIVPCSGFYEWRTEGKAKIPFYFRPGAGGMFAIAGIWEPARAAEALPTVALITVAANETIRALHDRMPAMLQREDYASWLNPKNPSPEALLRTMPAEQIEAFTVSTRVNGVRDEGPALIEPERRGLFG